MSVAAARPHAAVVYSRFLKIEHTLFSFPVIFAGTILADPRGLTLARILLIALAGFGARTAAMAANRIIDRELDAKNPRTASRELPTGALSLGEARLILLAGVALYAAAAAALSPLCLLLSPIPLAVFIGYPYLKRVTPLCHLGVGAALGLAPLGGWLAAGPSRLSEIGPNAIPPLLLALFTFLWVAGFDVIYATLDEETDRAQGIRSLPAALGRSRALAAAGLFHAAGFVALVALQLTAFRSAAGLPFLLATAVVLVLEHRLAHRVDLAFFKLNVVVGFTVFAFVLAGVLGGRLA